MPCTDSFTDFVKTSIIKPYHSLKIIEGILHHFEIETEDEEDSKSDRSDDFVQTSCTISTQEDVKDTIKAERQILPEQENKVTTTSVSRWERITDTSSTGAAAAEIKKKKNDSNNSFQERKSARTDFLRKREIKIQPNSENPLLANNRGTYVGRNLCNNFFDQIQVIRSPETLMIHKQTMKEKAVTKKQMVTEKENAGKNDKDKLKDKRSISQKIPTSLGSAASYRNGASKIKVHACLDRKQSTGKSKQYSGQDGRSKPLRFGAAALAARAGLAMRKRKS